MIGEARRETPTSGGPEDVIDQMVGAMVDAAVAAGVETGSMAGIGVGSPGEVDDKRGTVTGAKNLPGWDGAFPMAKALSGALDAPVRIGNDVQVATNSEARLGAGRGHKSLLGVFWGTGVGGGIVLDGKPWVGRSAGGEIGHMVIQRGGRRCPCGRKGCMEAYAGRAAMEARARKLMAKGHKTSLFEVMEHKHKDRLTSAVWADCLRHGDEVATKLIDEAVLALGAGIASACNLLDVEAVIIGGGLGLRLGEPYRKRIEKQAMKNIFALDNPPAVKLAELGDLGGAIGAALLVE